jgi:UDP-N-acetylglucosamine:LPS N-acetylglucosamine transferase
VESFTRAADFILGKAGGLIVSEVLAYGLPLSLVDVIPGQETGNANHVVSGNAGALARGQIEVFETMCHWLEKDRRFYRQQAHTPAGWGIQKPPLMWLISPGRLPLPEK